MVTIKVRQNGPYLVEGDDVILVDWNGAPYQIPKRPFALYRCGGSMTKPRCRVARTSQQLESHVFARRSPT